MQNNNLYRQVEFEEEFDLISNIGDKFVYLKKVEADQQELWGEVENELDGQIYQNQINILKSKYILIPKH